MYIVDSACIWRAALSDIRVGYLVWVVGQGGADQHSNGTTSQARQQHKFKFFLFLDNMFCLHMIRYQYDWHYETLVKDNHISLSDAL